MMGSPYFSSLARQGTSFTRFYGIMHPSQPNYIALFSGSTHGLIDDGHYDLSGPNLANSLIYAGFTFCGYSQGLPGVGSRVDSSGAYRRKHNPWASFANVPDKVNRPYTDFPPDYALLPDVSFVVPDQNFDMHDGSIAAADNWLETNLDGYVQWAKTHNSLFVVTFDECSDRKPVGSTPIAAIMVGAGIKSAEDSTPLNLYSLLRMIMELYKLDFLGEEQYAPRIHDPWDQG